jgi:hypothetical protein
VSEHQRQKAGRKRALWIIRSVIGYSSAFFILLIILFLVLIQSLIGNQKIFDPAIKFLSRLLPAMFGISHKNTREALSSLKDA